LENTRRGLLGCDYGPPKRRYPITSYMSSQPRRPRPESSP